MRHEERVKKVNSADPNPKDRIYQCTGASGSPALGIPVWAIARLRWITSNDTNAHQ